MTPGEKKISDFYDKFVASYGDEAWTGFKKKYFEQLKAVNSAETEAEADRAWKDFGRNVGTKLFERNVKDGTIAPKDYAKFRAMFNAYESPETLGSYEDMKKNKAFGKKDWKNKAKDGSDNVPVMAIVNDPVKLKIAAEELGMDPEELRAEVDRKFREWQTENARKADKERVDQTNKARQKIVKNYENEKLFTLPVINYSVSPRTFVRTFAPEIDNWAEQAILTGDDSEGFGKAVLKDVAYNAATNVGGLGVAGKAVAGATKAASKVAPRVAAKVAGVLPTSPIGKAAYGATKDAAIEGAREAASDYEDVDAEKIGETFGASLTMPAFLTAAGSGARRIQGAGKSTVSKEIRSGNFTGKTAKLKQGLNNTALIVGAREAQAGDSREGTKYNQSTNERMWAAGFVPNDKDSQDYEDYVEWYRKEHGVYPE